MNILSVENISKSYGLKKLFENISFGLDKGEKIGLIGVNGTGKTTFLKIIAGVEPADQGKVTLGNDVEVGYLPQEPDFDSDVTVLQQIFKGNSPVMQLLRDYEDTLDKLNQTPEDQSIQKKLMTLSQKMDALDAWQIESEAKAILTKLGISNFQAKVGNLSGGQRKRIALASALINPTDVLILDEPTNHIDNETVVWLEEYLNNRKGALIMVTHDRYFLNRVVNRIFELDENRLFTYSGNYSTFLEAKVEREERELVAEKKRQNIFRNELAWIRRGAKARSTKQKARIERFEKLKDDRPNLQSDEMEISVATSRLGKKVIEIDEVNKSYSEINLIDNFSYTLLRDDRIGIIGPNGSGKSTLLNIIAGKIEVDTGSVDVGQTVKIGYFSQENEGIDGDLRVIEYIREAGEYLPTSNGGIISAAQMLERFLFSRDHQWFHISTLSGGEKRRLFLLRILMGAPNILLFDEPTNDLDIQILTILEDYLDQFPGAVIVVSHDRYFLDRVVEKIFAFEGNGKIKEYPGNYSLYQQKIAEKSLLDENKVKVSGNKNNYNTEKKKDRSLKFTFKEKKEFEEIDEIIENLELELEEVAEKINFAGSDYQLMEELVKNQQNLEQQLEEKMERWTYLNELAEKIENQRK
ncbi:MAG: ABC-F family ATP-binding cassette domain-containing protein [Halanaerobiales bacterium]|nr:ABC-F family ATP-binding cassette domain-containing protein [Halanaerobiales bacterium]